MVPVKEYEVLNNIEIDVGAARVTADGYGRLTIRYNPDVDRYELYDVSNRVAVTRDPDLEAIVARANELTPMEVEIQEKPLISLDECLHDPPEAADTDV